MGARLATPLRGWPALASLLAVVLLASCGPRELGLADAAAAELFRGLHRPVYGVYELGPDRDAIHDLLASSFTGEALTRQYVEHFTTLVRMRREETSIRVVRVDYEAVEVLERRPGSIRVEADWSVGGVVSHQSHKHLRTNRYRAVYDLEPTGEGWRIVSTRLRDLRRVETGLGLSTDLPSSAGGLMSPLELLRAGVGTEDEEGVGGGEADSGEADSGEAGGASPEEPAEEPR